LTQVKALARLGIQP